LTPIIHLVKIKSQRYSNTIALLQEWIKTEQLTSLGSESQNSFNNAAQAQFMGGSFYISYRVLIVRLAEVQPLLPPVTASILPGR